MSIVSLVRNKGDYHVYNQEELLAGDVDFSDIVFMIDGPITTESQGAVETIKRAARDLEMRAPPRNEKTGQGYYVYGYFESENDQLWETAFYIGKGKQNRAYSHLGSRIRSRERNIGIVGKTDKERKIDKWLDQQTLPLRRRELRDVAHNNLIALLYTELSELEAFFVEKFLIMRCRNPQEVTNQNAGIHKCQGYTSVCQPKEYDSNNSAHCGLWKKVVDEFLRDPRSDRLKHTLRPGLTFIGLESRLDALASHFASIGLQECDVSQLPENRLSGDCMVRKFCGVHGAADAKVSFRHPDKPYRIDLRLPPGRLETNITLRPLKYTKRCRQTFLEFFENIELEGSSNHGRYKITTAPLKKLYPEEYIRNKAQWPYFKPLAMNAKGGDGSGWFPMADPEFRIPLRVNWIDGHDCELSMCEALKIISDAF